MVPAAFGLSALGFAEEVVESLWTLQLVVQWVGPAGPSPASPCPHTHRSPCWTGHLCDEMGRTSGLACETGQGSEV